MAFDPAYVSNVLGENFKDAQALFLRPLLSIHRAHLVMLAHCGIVSPADARRLRDALDTIVPDAVQQAAFDGGCEDLFFHVERLIAATATEDVAGRLHTARSRNDIDMTMYRMRQREFMLDVVHATAGLRESLLDQAAAHRETVFAAHTHTQPAQPTTIAHYLLAVIEQLERDTTRLRAAFASTNRCPLGSCAITGTGFPIDRQLTSDLLGFEAPTGNTYGSIATVDYLLESMTAVAVMLTGIGRVLQDLLLWCTVEFGYLRLDDGFVQSSSIMPQKRNPVALEHARAITSRALGQAHAVMLAVHNTPFGDIVDTEDDLQPLVAATYTDALRVLRVTAAAMASAQFDRRRVEERAGTGGTTLTELADQLVRDHDIPFRRAHAVAARLLPVIAGGDQGSMTDRLASASRDIIGRSIDYSEHQLRELLSPRHFVAVRQTAGGPAPPVTADAIDTSRRLLATDRNWLATARARLTEAADDLRHRAAEL